MQYEAYEQRKVIEYCRLRNIVFFSVPNGGRRGKREAYFLKLEGCSPGVPDLCFPIPTKKYHGLFIELKHGKNKPTKYQLQWLDYLNKAGYLAVICYDHEAAIKALNNYINERY